MSKSGVTVSFSDCLGNPNEQLVVAGAVWRAARRFAARSGLRLEGVLTPRQAARFAKLLRQHMVAIDQQPGRGSDRRLVAGPPRRASLEALAAFLEQGRPVRLHG
jgi:hypothetical protein